MRNIKVFYYLCIVKSFDYEEGNSKDNRAER